MVKFANKVKLLKEKLKLWTEILLKIFIDAKGHILTCENLLDHDPSESNKKKLCKAQMDLAAKLETKENFWRQRDNIK